jgi:hypothetical protein
MKLLVLTCQTGIKVTSKVARSKKKSSAAATDTSEEPPIPEDGARKHPPVELIEELKQKVTTLWSRGKAKRVVIVDLLKGKDTGPLSNEIGVSFCSQCNENCISSLSTPHKKCCERETHISLNKVGEYVVFHAKTVHQGFFSVVNKNIVTSQLFCSYSNSAELPRVNCSETETIGIQTGTLSVFSYLSNSVLMIWDADHPHNKFKPPQACKLEPVNTEQNRVVLREQLQDCAHLSYLVSKFEEKCIWLEVQSVWLIWKLKEGNGFQNWHQDLACNGKTVN